MKVMRVDTWVASLKDKPGNLAGKLRAMSAAGVNLDFVIARRAPEKPGAGVVFATPIKGAKQCRAAKAAGFRKSKHMHTVRVEGADRRGRGAKMAEALAAAGINLRGLSAAAIGKTFVCHIALDTSADATRAVKLLKKM